MVEFNSCYDTGHLGLICDILLPSNLSQISRMHLQGSMKLRGYDVRQGSYGTKHVEPNLKVSS